MTTNINRTGSVIIRMFNPLGLFLILIMFFAMGVGNVLAGEGFLYLESNNVSEGQNSIVGYKRTSEGLEPLPGSPYLTGGTGLNNSTNGKLGPNDIDTPIILSADNKRLFAVNGHSNTIAVFDILPDGSLRHVKGSPFPSEGIGPVSLSLSGDVLLAANRNEDPHQLAELTGGALSNYASFKVGPDGALTFISRSEIEDGQKPTQVYVSNLNDKVVLGNDFQVDADFDGDGDVSKLFGKEPQVRGRLQAFRLGDDGSLIPAGSTALPETAEPAPDVPTVPLGIWGHPTQNLLYVGFVTRNELGVFEYDVDKILASDAAGTSYPEVFKFVTSVPNSGQDICWIRVNADGTRLYAVNNLPREDEKDKTSTVTIFDISGDNARKPLEIGRVQIPMPGTSFLNNRNAMQPGSTAFQLDIDPSGKTLYVLNQRIDQTPANSDTFGNVLHTFDIGPDGLLTVRGARKLGKDGVHSDSRPQGIVTFDSQVGEE
jgi:hypothetical protein